MAMRGRVFNLGIFPLLLLNLSYCNAQSSDSLHQIRDENHLREKLEKLIVEEYYIDTTSDLKTIFELKVDSLGEVHSAHIRWSQNLKISAYYPICREIESTFNLMFLYNRYKKEFLGGKYVYASVPFFSPDP